jgi:hypothetical protein
VTQRIALSAYVPAKGQDYVPAQAADGFEDPLKLYILETVERDTRSKRLRQLGIALVLVGGIFVSQWPVAFSSANAVTSVVMNAEASISDVSTILPERLAFAAGMRDGF